jgi:hypothetical protein
MFPNCLGEIKRMNLFHTFKQVAVMKKRAQQSVHPTLGILARFQAFFYTSAFSSRTAFRRPPQRG